MNILGLSSIVYFVETPQLVGDWFSEVLGFSPYRNEVNFVGFSLDNFEIGIHSSDKKAPIIHGNQVAYWNTSNIEYSIERLMTHGCSIYRSPITIDGLKICQLKSPFGFVIGLMQKLQSF